MKRSYVAAFLGFRDNFQVPWALEEAGMLDRFITGGYRTAGTAGWTKMLPARTLAKMQRRHCAGIPDDRVDSRLELDLLLHLSSWMGDRSLRSWNWANKAMSLAARNAVRKHRSSLFLYEPYAWEALTADYQHAPHKVLFHFHPHPVFERELIAGDAEKCPPSLVEGWQRTDARPEWDDRVIDAWRHADLVLCASSFTRQSLLRQGLPPERCRVIPYGIEMDGETELPRQPSSYSVLCVGTGIQRKGMHHLLKAWSLADLPSGATLTLVCRHLDPCLEAMLDPLPSNVILHRGVSAEKLKDLFRSSALFVLPSLLEGFGQVFLEALSLGCPVLGTPNTCLPDLGDESQGIFTVSAGDTEALKCKLEELAGPLVSADAPALRTRCVHLARTFTWPRFRRTLIEALAPV